MFPVINTLSRNPAFVPLWAHGARCTITIIKIFIYPVISAIFRIFLNKPLESKRNSMQNRDPTIQKWIHIYIFIQ